MAADQSLTRIELEPPYLIYLADVGDDGHAKTGFGIAYWRPEKCVGQMRLPSCNVDIGLPELDVEAAVAAGVRTAIIGVAPSGGKILPHWIEPLQALARAGINIAAGLHNKLSAIPALREAAAAGGAQLIDVRMPPPDLPVGTGRRRTGKRVLMVGTDCAVGKKYSALALHRELEGRGVKASFRATGQTGIMIAGEGVPIDSVVADFISGAAEALSPDNDADHWDVIEGQGAIMHPSYAGVSVGLLMGSQPDALVLCHDATRTEILGLEGSFPVPAISEVIERNLLTGRVTNPDVVCVGISVNTSRLDASARTEYLSQLEAETGLPCVDPVAGGMASIADNLLERG